MIDKDKKRTRVNLTIRADIIRDAKSLEINASQEAEKGIAAAIKKKRETEWLEQNKDAIDAYNEMVEKNGLLLEPYWLQNNGEI